jgi:predicted homoserine dehydrogenase-like protein
VGWRQWAEAALRGLSRGVPVAAERWVAVAVRQAPLVAGEAGEPTGVVPVRGETLAVPAVRAAVRAVPAVLVQGAAAMVAPIICPQIIRERRLRCFRSQELFLQQTTTRAVQA